MELAIIIGVVVILFVVFILASYISKLPKLMQQSRQMMQESKLRLLLQKEITNLRLRNKN